MVNILARALMIASRCEPLEEADQYETCRYGFDTNRSMRSVPLDRCRLGKSGFAAKTVKMLRSKRGPE